MKRVAIVGSPGAGKTTLSIALGRATGLPVIHLDALYWHPGWVETDRETWANLQSDLAGRPQWIMDGNYGKTMDVRIQAADTVVFLDLPRTLCVWRAMKRFVKHRGRTRPDVGEGCEERMEWGFLVYIWRFPNRSRESILRRLRDAENAGKQVVYLRSRSEVKKFLQKMHANDHQHNTRMA